MANLDVYMGTLVIAMRCAEGVVIVADRDLVAHSTDESKHESKIGFGGARKVRDARIAYAATGMLAIYDPPESGGGRLWSLSDELSRVFKDAKPALLSKSWPSLGERLWGSIAHHLGRMPPEVRTGRLAGSDGRSLFEVTVW